MDSKQPIYFDHAATTPLHPSVLEQYTDGLADNFGNPNSLHSFGRTAYGTLEKARAVLADYLNASSNEIIFTSGGTESDNTAILQVAETRKKYGNHIITTNVEHSAVLEPMHFLETKGFNVTYLKADETGQVSLEQVKQALKKETILVSIMYGNNELGTIMPIEAIGRYLKATRPDIVFHTDAVQAFGLETIDVKKQGIDLLSASAHKLNGPKGVGLLYAREDLSFESFMKGGSQELKRRAGTVNVPGISAFQKATEIMRDERNQKNALYEHLREEVIQKLTEAGILFQVNGNEKEHLSHILSIWLKQIPSDRMLTQLDLSGIAVAAGSACSAGNPEPSHVLTAVFGEDHPAVKETIRISFGLKNTKEDVGRLVSAIQRAAQRYQK